MSIGCTGPGFFNKPTDCAGNKTSFESFLISFQKDTIVNVNDRKSKLINIVISCDPDEIKCNQLIEVILRFHGTNDIPTSLTNMPKFEAGALNFHNSIELIQKALESGKEFINNIESIKKILKSNSYSASEKITQIKLILL